MKEKLTFNDIRPLIDGDPIIVFKDGWDEKDIIYKSGLISDNDKEYDNFVERHGDTAVRCISTYYSKWPNIAILI